MEKSEEMGGLDLDALKEIYMAGQTPPSILGGGGAISPLSFIQEGAG